MRNPRIYQAQAFEVGQTQALSDDAFGHTVRVLRLKDGDDITLFNGVAEQQGYYEYQAKLCNVGNEQWQKIVISACEQSGRCAVPIVAPPIYLDDWLQQDSSALKLNLHPRAQHSIMNLPIENNRVRLLIGPEGGLSNDEISTANSAGFHDVLLGPRVLRTETAALTAITALQCRYGDLT